MEPAADLPVRRHRSPERHLSSARWRPISEGVGLLVPLAAATVAAARFAPMFAPIPLVLGGAIALAFRDPERAIEQREGAALSPADGRVLRVAREVDDYWQTEMTEIAIFLALQDVHVQRIPVAGEVVAQRRKAGGYKPAMTEAATHGNNQLATYIQTAHGPCTVTQISGLVARRIVTWSQVGDHGELQTKSGYAGSFFTGILATVVATPCSAPFLAPALGAALALPVAQSFTVFTAIGVGLSTPYLVLSVVPQAVKVLPRPGAWMETFKQFMAFPLYATVMYLLWVLAGQVDESALLTAGFGLVLVAMAAWAYGRWTTAPGASDGRRRFGAWYDARRPPSIGARSAVLSRRSGDAGGARRTRRRR